MSNIILKDISYHINNKLILNAISHTFKNNTITALIGPSGSGKSTLLKLLNGLHSPSSGTIYFDEHHIDDYDLIELRKKVGIALQSAPMIKGTVYDNLNLPKSLFNENLPEEEARQLLNEVELSDIELQRNIKNLSGGQRQRLSIARTLVNQPEILLLDEITSSLDPQVTKEIEQLIRNIQVKRKTTIIMVTHNIQQAARASDHCMLLESGEIVYSGNSNELFKSNNTYVERFLKGIES